jgi:hypothetical protein
MNLLDSGSSSNSSLTIKQLSEVFADIIQRMELMFVFKDPSDKRIPKLFVIDNESSS